ncbi:MAG: MobA/MobL family protein [Coriobacteriales bacterium]|nr:MobA/MobL family protein [Coriobacteriales bacterium]
MAFADVLLPEHAPSEWQDRSELWNAVERSSLGGRGARRGEVALCREANFALPRELSLDDQIELAHEYARSFAREGMCVDLAIHLGHGINPHAHMMLTLAPCDESGFLPRSCTEYLVRNDAGEERYATAAELKELGSTWQKAYRYKRKDAVGKPLMLTKSEAGAIGLHPTKDRRSKAPVQRTRYLADFAGRDEEKLVEWRKRWADVCNAYLEARGIEERIDHRSNAERGTGLLPTIHEGYAVRAIEERARKEAEEGREYVPVTERRRINERRRRINRRLMRLMEEIREIVLSRLERAKSEKTKRAAQRKAAQRRRARRKRPYAPARGRHVSVSGGLSK